jgi:Cdc6-like AAA superfamily ATPase
MMTTPAGVALSYRRVFVCATTSSVYEFLGRDTSEMVPQGEPSGEEAQVTWQALEERLNRTEEGRDLLSCFKDDPSGARDALVRWLNSHRVNLFPQFSTNISGMVDKLVQIAQAGTVVVNPPSSVFDDLKDVLQNKHRHPNQSDLERGAYYRRDVEHDKTHALLARERLCLIIGKPGHGKTAIAKAVGYELLKEQKQTVFYLSAKTQHSWQPWLRHIKSADFSHITYIIDDCHDAIDSINEFIARW